MGSAKDKKVPKTTKAGRPSKEKKTKTPPVIHDSETQKPRPKPKPKPISKPGSKKTSVTSPLDIDSLPQDVLTATQGLLGLSNGLKEDQEYCDLEQPDPKDDDAENGGRVTLDPEAMSNSTESSDEEDEEDKDSAFNLEFMVPIDGATDSTTYSSNITWTDFHYQVADEMGIHMKDLNLAYQFSTMLQKELPCMLQTPVHLARLFMAAQKELNEQAKSKSKAKQKEFKVVLIDRDAGKRGKNEGGRKDGQKRVKSKKDDSDSEQAGDSDETDIAPKKKTAPQYIIELQAEHACGNHSGEYCPLESVIEMSSHPFPYYYPYPPPPPPGYGALHYHHYPPQTPTPQASSSHAHSHLKVPSSDSFDPNDAPTIYPHVLEWLFKLDSGKRGADGQVWGQYASVLDNSGYK
ncbi:uncharacterized protein EDB91DRAFT_1249784 [Suillus paluster]|uniref:uncharacterized protein n=1 Tax=Suillus paluster TaxID=48578 RepID=UPI001B87B780|nr:uncharacterized protein EDB91DRAFT_1249784 [Suillus paluster]KAG1737136.1 hypothetical protein EDB91DRAFT_1249784 [Suillus paluster]